jgi:membrane-associated phospholipid phosphatase
VALSIPRTLPRPDDPNVEIERHRAGRRRAGALALGAVALALATAGGRGRAVDDRLFGWVNNRSYHPALDAFFRTITELGSLWAAAAAAGAIAAAGRRREAGDALGAAGTMWLAGQGLKRLFRRVRPYDADLPAPLRLLIGKPRGASWPSSHPAVLLVFVTVAGRDLGLAAPARGAVAGLAGLVGASRVYLGVHYPADVAGGLLLGRALADVWSRTVSPKVLG